MDASVTAAIRSASLSAGFTVGGEGLAVDLVDTIKVAVDPAIDLLDTDARYSDFWLIHQAQLPAGSGVPARAATLHLRDAARVVLTAALDGTTPHPDAVAVINAVAASSIPVPQLTAHGVEWTTARGGDPALGAVAASVIDTATSAAALLRQCGRPGCSMLFLASRRPRTWCSDACGNRVRVARFDSRARER